MTALRTLAAAVLLASPFTGVPAMALPAGRSLAGPGAREAAAAFRLACGGLKLTEPKTGGWKRKRAGTEALPAHREEPEENVAAEHRADDDDDAAVPAHASAQRPQREDGAAPRREPEAARAARPDSTIRGDEDAWTVVVKEEPVSQVTMDLPTQVLPVEMEPANIAVPTQVEAPKPAEDDEFFDDMD